MNILFCKYLLLLLLLNEQQQQQKVSTTTTTSFELVFFWLSVWRMIQKFQKQKISPPFFSIESDFELMFPKAEKIQFRFNRMWNIMIQKKQSPDLKDFCFFWKKRIHSSYFNTVTQLYLDKKSAKTFFFEFFFCIWWI